MLVFIILCAIVEPAILIFKTHSLEFETDKVLVHFAYFQAHKKLPPEGKQKRL